MILNVRKTIDTKAPVKAWKIITKESDGPWFTGFIFKLLLAVGNWQSATGPGFFAFKTRAGARQVLHQQVRGGYVVSPAYIVPCYLRGKVEFGLYAGVGKIKGIRGSQLLVKEKHMPRVYQCS